MDAGVPVIFSSVAYATICGRQALKLCQSMWCASVLALSVQKDHPGVCIKRKWPHGAKETRTMGNPASWRRKQWQGQTDFNVTARPGIGPKHHAYSPSVRTVFLSRWSTLAAIWADGTLACQNNSRECYGMRFRAAFLGRYQGYLSNFFESCVPSNTNRVLRIALTFETVISVLFCVTCHPCEIPQN